MSELAIFYRLVALSKHPCSSQHEARREAKRTWICPGCGSPKPGVKAVDVWIQDRAPRGKPLNILWLGGIGLIHNELLECVDPTVVQRDLYLGKVIGDRGNQIQDWFTFRGRREVIVRGNKQASFRICDVCRRVLYFSMGKQYLSPAPLADATVFETHPGGLLVPEDIYQRVKLKKWRAVGIEKLPVLDEPLDGLGSLPGE